MSPVLQQNDAPSETFNLRSPAPISVDQSTGNPFFVPPPSFHPPPEHNALPQYFNPYIQRQEQSINLSIHHPKP